MAMIGAAAAPRGDTATVAAGAAGADILAGRDVRRGGLGGNVALRARSAAVQAGQSVRR
ncbi:MAG TPA: hypothetical protein VGP33_09135 [Chloroflexota bacterium]|nr:hypothetical protein [Chloroflexota bacterium]